MRWAFVGTPLWACISPGCLLGWNPYAGHDDTDDADADADADTDADVDADADSDTAAGIGGSLQFDGVDDAVDVDSVAAFSPASITVEAWIRPFDFAPEVSRSNVVGTDAWWDEAEKGFSLDVGAGIPNFAIGTGVGWPRARSEIAINADEWAHVAGQYNGSEVSIYVNGVLTGTVISDLGIAAPTLTLRIADTPMDGTPDTARFFEGLVDEVRVSDVARYSGDFTPPYPLEPDADAIGCWHFDDGTGSSVSDASGQGHHGRIVGAPTWSSVTVQ